MAGGPAHVEPLFGAVGSRGLHDFLLPAGAGRGEHAALPREDVPQRRSNEKRKGHEDLQLHAEDVSVRHRAGIRAAFDAPVVAGPVDVPGGTASAPLVADAAVGAALLADGLHTGIYVRAFDAGVERVRMEP